MSYTVATFSNIPEICENGEIEFKGHIGIMPQYYMSTFSGSIWSDSVDCRLNEEGTLKGTYSLSGSVEEVELKLPAPENACAVWTQEEIDEAVLILNSADPKNYHYSPPHIESLEEGPKAVSGGCSSISVGGPCWPSPSEPLLGSGSLSLSGDKILAKEATDSHPALYATYNYNFSIEIDWRYFYRSGKNPAGPLVSYFPVKKAVKYRKSLIDSCTWAGAGKKGVAPYRVCASDFIDFSEHFFERTGVVGSGFSQSDMLQCADQLIEVFSSYQKPCGTKGGPSC